MSSILVGRTRARSQAIQLLFQAEVQGVDVFDLLAGRDYVLEDGPLDEYGEQLARGVARTRLAIDRLIAGVSQNWNLSRMPLVDRAIMSVAIHEMFDEEEVPTSVAISEAVEISKVYGTDDSSSFVNGVLGRVARMAEEHAGMSLAQLAKTVSPVEDETSAEGAAPAEADAPAEPATELAEAPEPTEVVAEPAAPVPAEAMPAAEAAAPACAEPDADASAACEPAEASESEPAREDARSDE